MNMEDKKEIKRDKDILKAAIICFIIAVVSFAIMSVIAIILSRLFSINEANETIRVIRRGIIPLLQIGIPFLFGIIGFISLIIYAFSNNNK